MSPSSQSQSSVWRFCCDVQYHQILSSDINKMHDNLYNILLLHVTVKPVLSGHPWGPVRGILMSPVWVSNQNWALVTKFSQLVTSWQLMICLITKDNQNTIFVFQSLDKKLFGSGSDTCRQFTFPSPINNAWILQENCKIKCTLACENCIKVSVYLERQPRIVVASRSHVS